jgi:hypothetical protein
MTDKNDDQDMPPQVDNILDAQPIPGVHITTIMAGQAMNGSTFTTGGSAKATPDMVNHPPHYATHPSGVEAIEIREGMRCPLADAFKYLFRRDGKGAPVDDLRKAVWYMRRNLGARRGIPKPFDDVTSDAFWGNCEPRPGPNRARLSETIRLTRLVLDFERKGDIASAMGLVVRAHVFDSLGRRYESDDDLECAIILVEREIAERTKGAA